MCFNALKNVSSRDPDPMPGHEAWKHERREDASIKLQGSSITYPDLIWWGANREVVYQLLCCPVFAFIETAIQYEASCMNAFCRRASQTRAPTNRTRLPV